MRPANAAGRSITLRGSAGHVLSTTHRGLNLAVTIRAFRNMYGLPVLGLQRSMYELFITLATGHRADAHAAFFTGIDCHHEFSLFMHELVCQKKFYNSHVQIWANRYGFRGFKEQRRSTGENLKGQILLL